MPQSQRHDLGSDETMWGPWIPKIVLFLSWKVLLLFQAPTALVA
jgi:hypothetical protein